MADELDRLTTLIRESQKSEYMVWCAKNTEGNMSMPVRRFILWINENQPTWHEVWELFGQGEAVRDG